MSVRFQFFLQGDLSTTVVIALACLRVTCPQEGDSPQALACVGGVCADPECTDGTQENCPASCRDPNDCPDPSSLCAVPRCEQGVCLEQTSNRPCDGRELCRLQTEISEIECNALVTLYESTGGANWVDNTNWLMTRTPCSWLGITCSDGHVERLALVANALTGTVPPELGNLTKLTNLSFHVNQLEGTIPPELGNLSNLTTLWLSFNQLHGSIPPELGNLSLLESLYLHHNQLGGEIPSELGNLTNLRTLHLERNRLDGSIPSEIGISGLSNLLLDSNRLTGTIPVELGTVTNLELQNNQLIGPLPDELGAGHRRLLHNNRLEGEVPLSFMNVMQLSLSGNDCLISSSPELATYLDLSAPDWNDGCGVTCTDDTMNGTETDIDCGGICSACFDEQSCEVDADCVSGDCSALVCVP